MGYFFAVLTILVYLFYFTLILRLIFDWIQQFAPYWRPKGMVLLLASAVNAVTDPPMNFLRRRVPPLNIGGLSLDLGFLILVILVGALYPMLISMTRNFS